MRKCRVFLGDIRWGLFFSNRFVGEVYEAVDDIVFMYAKPYGSMFIWFSVMYMCTLRALYVVYVVNKYK